MSPVATFYSLGLPKRFLDSARARRYRIAPPRVRSVTRRPKSGKAGIRDLSRARCLPGNGSRNPYPDREEFAPSVFPIRLENPDKLGRTLPPGDRRWRRRKAIQAGLG